MELQSRTHRICTIITSMVKPERCSMKQIHVWSNIFLDTDQGIYEHVNCLLENIVEVPSYNDAVFLVFFEKVYNIRESVLE